MVLPLNNLDFSIVEIRWPMAELGLACGGGVHYEYTLYSYIIICFAPKPLHTRDGHFSVILIYIVDYGESNGA